MADGVPTKTQKITRDQLAAIFQGNQRAIKLFENLFADVAVTLPDAIVDVDLAQRYSLQSADGSKSISQRAERTAVEAESLMLTFRTHATAIDELRRAVADLQVQEHAARTLAATVSTLRRELEELRALILGV